MSQPIAIGFLSVDDFNAVQVELPIEGITDVDYDTISDAYDDTIKRIENNPNEKTAKIFRLISQLLSFHFKPSDRGEPFGPLWVIDERRTAIPSDFRGHQNDVLAAVAPTIKNPALRARFADVAWLNNRKLADCGRLAVRAYVECVERILKGEATSRSEDAKPWATVSVKMLRRALVIANAMGRRKPEAQLAAETLERIAAAAKAQGDASGIFRVAKLALDFGTTEPEQVRVELETAADGISGSRNFPFAIDIYKEAERACRIGRNTTSGDRCAEKIAKCYVAWADACKGSAMNEAHWLMQAISTLRGVKGTREQRDALQARMVTVQANIRDEMGTVKTETDLAELVDQTTTLLSGRPLVQVLADFARLEKSPDPEVLLRQARQSAEQTPLIAVMSSTMHDHEGKIIASSSGSNTLDPADGSVLQHLIFQHESHRRAIAVEGIIEPARQLIYAEHPLEEGDLLPLMAMSPFVAPDRELIYARAFARFFGGDFMSSAHMIFPQVENSLRYVLKQAGYDVSNIKSDLIQQDVTLSILLNDFRAQLEAVFGKATVLEVENLFDAQGGPALRHSAAHGLLGQGAFWSRDVIYACWFVFRLCVVPLFPIFRDVEAAYAI